MPKSLPQITQPTQLPYNQTFTVKPKDSQTKKAYQNDRLSLKMIGSGGG